VSYQSELVEHDTSDVDGDVPLFLRREVAERIADHCEEVVEGGAGGDRG